MPARRRDHALLKEAFMLKERCALITGSTGGIGFATASRLAADRCNIVLNGFAPADEILAISAALS
jgi:3-hydroxybutyrate dehydrogenase